MEKKSNRQIIGEKLQKLNLNRGRSTVSIDTAYGFNIPNLIRKPAKVQEYESRIETLHKDIVNLRGELDVYSSEIAKMNVDRKEALGRTELGHPEAHKTADELEAKIQKYKKEITKSVEKIEAKAFAIDCLRAEIPPLIHEEIQRVRQEITKELEPILNSVVKRIKPLQDDIIKISELAYSYNHNIQPYRTAIALEYMNPILIEEWILNFADDIRRMLLNDRYVPEPTPQPETWEEPDNKIHSAVYDEIIDDDEPEPSDEEIEEIEFINVGPFERDQDDDLDEDELI